MSLNLRLASHTVYSLLGWCIVVCAIVTSRSAHSQSLTDYRRFPESQQAAFWLKTIKKADDWATKTKRNLKADQLTIQLLQKEAQRKLPDLYAWQAINIEHRSRHTSQLVGNWVQVIDSAFQLTGYPVIPWQGITKAQQNGLIRTGADSAHYVRNRSTLISRVTSQVRRSDSVGHLRTWIAYLKSHQGYASDTTVKQLENLVDTILYKRVAGTKDIRLIQSYLLDYPESVLKEAATDLLDDLLYIKEAGDSRLVNLKRYLQVHPSSKYNVRIKNRIFKLQLANSVPDSLKAIVQYGGQVANQATLLHQLINPKVGLTKSAIPFLLPLTPNRFNWCFVADSGQTFYQSDTVEEEVCERGWPLVAYNFPITEARFKRLSIASDTSIAVDSISYLGIGWFKLTKGSKTWLYSPANLTIDDSVADAEVLDNRLLVAKRKSVSGKTEGYKLYNFWGQPLLGGQSFEEIDIDEGILILTRGGLKTILPTDKLQAVEENGNLGAAFIYNELDYQGDNLWIAQKGDFTTLINTSGKRLMPLRRQRISKGPAWLWLAEFQDSQGQAYEVYDSQGKSLLLQPALALRAAANCIAFRTSKGWGIIGADGKEWQPAIWDTVSVLNRAVMVVSQGNTRLFSLGTGSWQVLPPKSRIEPLAAASDRQFSHFALYDSSGAVSIINSTGKVVVPSGFKTLNKVWVPTPGFFACRGLVETITEVKLTGKAGKRKKKTTTKREVQLAEMVGLYDTLGIQLLAPTYDGITQGTDGALLLVAGGKFGLYQTSTRQLIQPAYQQAIKPVVINTQRSEHTCYVVRQNDQFKLLDATGNQINLPQFEQLEIWGDDKLMTRNGDTVRFVTALTSAKPQVSDSYRLVRAYDQQSGFMLLSRMDNPGISIFRSGNPAALVPFDYQKIYWRRTETGYLVFAIKPSAIGRVKIEVFDDRLRLQASYEADEQVVNRLQCTSAD